MLAMPWSETKLLTWIHRRAQRSVDRLVVGSPGHDAAVLRRPAGREVLCVDQTIEDVHFEPGTAPRLVGHKAAARALSDLAATAAEPRALLLALAAPGEVRERWLRAAIAAVDATARAHGATLVGGDLARHAGPLALSVTAVGELTGSTRSVGRDRARAGDVVLLTGPVGGSRLGRHLRFEPRIDEGLWLHAHGARVLMDVSDGLALDLSRIAAASRVRIDVDEVPLHADARRAARASGRTALEHALGDGEDHELIATLPATAWRRCAARAQRDFPALRPIGRVRRGRGLWIPHEEDGSPVRWDGRGGFRHGA